MLKKIHCNIDVKNVTHQDLGFCQRNPRERENAEIRQFAVTLWESRKKIQVTVTTVHNHTGYRTYN